MFKNMESHCKFHVIKCMYKQLIPSFNIYNILHLMSPFKNLLYLIKLVNLSLRKVVLLYTCMRMGKLLACKHNHPRRNIDH